jgi:hypothetical protein
MWKLLDLLLLRDVVSRVLFMHSVSPRSEPICHASSPANLTLNPASVGTCLVVAEHSCSACYSELLGYVHTKPA